MADKSNLKDMGSCKNDLLNLILESQDIRNLLVGDSCSDEEWQGTDTDSGIVYKQVFPYLYVDETQKETLSYICFEVDVSSVPSGTMKNLQLTVWAYCHKQVMGANQRGYLGTRADMLADAVDRALMNSYDYGIGKLELRSARHFFPNTSFYGKELLYVVPDFKTKGGDKY